MRKHRKRGTKHRRARLVSLASAGGITIANVQMDGRDEDTIVASVDCNLDLSGSVGDMVPVEQVDGGRWAVSGGGVGSGVGCISLAGVPAGQALTSGVPALISLTAPSSDYWYRDLPYADTHDDDAGMLDFDNDQAVIPAGGFWLANISAVFDANGGTETAIVLQLVHRDSDGNIVGTHGCDHILSTPVLGDRRFSASALAPCFRGDTWEVWAEAREADNSLRDGIFSVAACGKGWGG